MTPHGTDVDGKPFIREWLEFAILLLPFFLLAAYSEHGGRSDDMMAGLTAPFLWAGVLVALRRGWRWIRR